MHVFPWSDEWSFLIKLKKEHKKTRKVIINVCMYNVKWCRRRISLKITNCTTLLAGSIRFG